MTTKKNWLVSVLALALPMAAGVLSSIAAGNMSTDMFYPNKPSFVPPSQVFPVVWTILYVLMGIAFYLVLNADTEKQNKKTAGFVFILQLALNFLWPVLFFRFGMCKAALLDICILWFVLFLNVVIFYRIKRTAGLLMVPYLIWVGFAIYLNLGFCILN